MDAVARFMSKTRREESGCLLWLGTKNHKGYGQFWFIDGMVQAHRFAYELKRGSIPPGKLVMHRCHNRACVESKHLKLGTDRQNLRERDRTGRLAYGERHGNAKLTFAKVVEIRRRYKAGESGNSLAKAYGVSQGTVSSVVRRESWRRAG